MIYTKKDKKWIRWLYIGTFLLLAVPGIFLFPVIMGEEVSFLAYAARLTGRDWSGALLTCGLVPEKYGTTFLWLLPFALFHNPVLIYRICEIISAILVAGVPIMVYHICRKYLAVKKEEHAAGIAAAVVLSGDIMYYSLNLRAESVLFVTGWACLWMLLAAGKSETQTKRMICSILLALFSGYAYACSDRGICLIAACTAAVLVQRLYFRDRGIQIPVFAGVLAILAAGDYFLQNRLQSMVWGAEHARAGLAAHLFAKGYFGVLVKVGTGWLYSTFTSSQGLAAFGILAALSLLFGAVIHTKRVNKELCMTAVFALVSYGISFVHGLLLTADGAHRNLVNHSETDIYQLISTRYVASFVGFFVLLALVVLILEIQQIRMKEKLISICLYLAALFLCAWKVAVVYDKGKVLRKGMGSLLLFTQPMMLGNRIDKPDLSNDILFFGVLVFVLFLSYLILLHGKKKESLLLISGVGILIYGVIVSENYIYNQYSRIHELRTVVGIMEDIPDGPEEFPVLVDADARRSAYMYQVNLIDQTVMKRPEDHETEPENAYVVMRSIQEEPDMNAPGTYYRFRSEEYYKEKQDVLIIKGEELCGYLEQNGYELVPYCTVE